VRSAPLRRPAFPHRGRGAPGPQEEGRGLRRVPRHPRRLLRARLRLCPAVRGGGVLDPLGEHDPDAPDQRPRPREQVHLPLCRTRARGHRRLRERRRPGPGPYKARRRPLRRQNSGPLGAPDLERGAPAGALHEQEVPGQYLFRADHRPEGPRLGDGRQPGQLIGLPRLRTAAQEEHRGRGLPALLAAGQDRRPPL
ncbi:MAG: Signal peptidase I, partial [uncultured Rubrobacteraceae bacterium]